MRHVKTFSVVAAGLLLAGAMAQTAHAAIFITEVDPTGSSASYAADWFELTNTGSSAVDITGWKMDDNSNLFANAVPIRGAITSIAAGQSVVFAEGNTAGTNDATIQTAFISAWFGGTAPAGFAMDAYGGSGVGLGAGGDSVNIFDSGGNLVTRVDFGTATAGTSFDNSADMNNVTLSTLSVAGVNGAFTAPSGEIGSPGVVPEPASLALLAFGGLALASRRVRR